MDWNIIGQIFKEIMHYLPSIGHFIYSYFIPSLTFIMLSVQIYKAIPKAIKILSPFLLFILLIIFLILFSETAREQIFGMFPKLSRVVFTPPRLYIFLGLPFVISIIYLIKLVRSYARKEYEDIIKENLKNDEELLFKITDAWLSKICDLAKRIIILSNSGDYLRANDDIRKLKELIHFTFESKTAYYIRLSLEIRGINITDKKYNFENLLEAYDSKNVYTIIDYLKSFIRKWNPNYELDELELLGSKFSIIDKGVFEKYNFSKIDILYYNIQLWKEYYPRVLKYENFIFPISFLFMFIILILSKNILIVYFLLFSIISLGILQAFISGTRDLLVKSSYDFLLNFYEIKEKNHLSKIDNIFNKIIMFEQDSEAFFLKKFWHIRNFLISADLLDNFEDIEKIQYPRLKCLNFAFLIYYLTTFPRKKFENFRIINYSSIHENFNLIDVTNSDFRYLLMIIYFYFNELLGNFKLIFRNPIDSIIKCITLIIKIVVWVNLFLGILSLLISPILLIKESLDLTLFIASIITLALVYIYVPIMIIRRSVLPKNSYIRIFNIILTLIIIFIFSSYLIFSCYSSSLDFYSNLSLMIMTLIPAIWLFWISLRKKY